jgi:hypothetical protein
MKGARLRGTAADEFACCMVFKNKSECTVLQIAHFGLRMLMLHHRVASGLATLNQIPHFVQKANSFLRILLLGLLPSFQVAGFWALASSTTVATFPTSLC